MWYVQHLQLPRIAIVRPDPCFCLLNGQVGRSDMGVVSANQWSQTVLNGHHNNSKSTSTAICRPISCRRLCIPALSNTTHANITRLANVVTICPSTQSAKMKWIFTKLVAVGCLTLIPGTDGSADASKTPQFQTLPPLREQAKIVDAWTAERMALIPGILRKYNIDAWLVRPPAHPWSFALTLFNQMFCRQV